MSDDSGAPRESEAPALAPDRETFVERADADGSVVVRAAVDLDLDVEPLAAYAALTGRTTDRTGAAYTFLLESAEKVASSDPDGAFAPTPDDRHARYSFVGYDPRAVVTVDDDATSVEVLDEAYADHVSPGEGDVLDQLRGAMPDVERRGFPDMEREHFQGGLVGFLAYDAVYDLWLDEVGLDSPESRFPDAQFVLTTSTLVFDEVEGTVSLVFTPVIDPEDDADARYGAIEREAARIRETLAAAGDLETDGFTKAGVAAGPQEEYERAVETAKEHVLAGDIYQGAGTVR